MAAHNLSPGFDRILAELGAIKQDSDTKDKEIQQLKSGLERKDGLWAQALEDVDRQEKVLQQTSDDLDSEKGSRRALQQEAKRMQAVMAPTAKLPHAVTKEPLPYVVALFHVSPDTFRFAPKFLDVKENGGKLAAEDLLEALDSYFSSIGIDLVGARIQIRLFWSFRDTPEASHVQMEIPSLGFLPSFWKSLNGAYPFVDSLTLGKGGSDVVDKKICENVKFHIGNPHCKHIILGVAHDSQISNSLQGVGAPAPLDRLTLLEGDVGGVMAKLTGPVKTLKLDNVFTWTPQPRKSSEGTAKRTYSNAFQPYVSDEADDKSGKMR